MHHRKVRDRRLRMLAGASAQHRLLRRKAAPDRFAGRLGGLASKAGPYAPVLLGGRAWRCCSQACPLHDFAKQSACACVFIAGRAVAA